MRNRIKVFDILIILAAAVLTSFAAYKAYISPQDNLRVFIRGQYGEWVYPVSATETVFVKGALGDTIVRLDGNGVWVDSSPCVNKNCAAAGKIYRHGQWTACLPNNVIILIQNAGENDVDIISR